MRYLPICEVVDGQTFGGVEEMTPHRTLHETQMMSVGEAAEYLGVSAASVRHWSDEGRLPVYRTPGNQRRFRRTDLKSFISSMRGFGASG